MTYDHELTLISQIITEDAIGNQVPVETETVILCGLKSIGRAEFYNAATTGLKPEITFIIHAYEYAGQKKVKFEGNYYSVIRTYEPSFEELELTCERIIADETGSAKLIDHKLVQDLKTLVETILADPDVTITPEDKAAYEDDLANVFVGW